MCLVEEGNQLQSLCVTQLFDVLQLQEEQRSQGCDGFHALRDSLLPFFSSKVAGIFILLVSKFAKALVNYGGHPAHVLYDDRTTSFAVITLESLCSHSCVIFFMGIRRRHKNHFSWVFVCRG